MSMEYVVQTFFQSWENKGDPTSDYKEAIAVLSIIRGKYPEESHRLACREVGDWCECREEK